jgi:hypothetical protein
VVKAYGSMSPSNDMVSGWEQKMKSIRQALPADVLTVGYLEKADLPGSTALHDPAEFFLAQYGLAPVVLERGFGAEWIVGNFGGGVSVETLTSWLDEIETMPSRLWDLAYT